MQEFKVRLWFVMRLKRVIVGDAPKAQYDEFSFIRDITLPFAPSKGLVLLAEDEKNPWLFVTSTVGYNLTHEMFNCEYAVEADDEKYQTVSKSLLASGWKQVEEK